MHGFGFKDRLFGGNSKARHTGPPPKAAWQALIEAENGSILHNRAEFLDWRGFGGLATKRGALRLGQKIIDTGCLVLKVLASQPPISAEQTGRTANSEFQNSSGGIT